MKNFIIALFVALLLPLSPTLSAACSGIRYHFTWKEPTINEDRTPITDLIKTTVFYSLNDGEVIKKDYVASKPTGGGSKSAHITVNMNCETAANRVTAWATATSTGGESAKGNVIIESVPPLGGN